MVVKWSACSPSIQRSEFESRWNLQFFFKFVFESNENKQKEAGNGPFYKKTIYTSFLVRRWRALALHWAKKCFESSPLFGHPMQIKNGQRELQCDQIWPNSRLCYNFKSLCSIFRNFIYFLSILWQFLCYWANVQMFFKRPYMEPSGHTARERNFFVVFC